MYRNALRRLAIEFSHIAKGRLSLCNWACLHDQRDLRKLSVTLMLPVHKNTQQ